MNPWLQMLSPWMSIRLPASGDVKMNYSPWTNWGWSASGAGDPEIEHELFTTVALPGKQLGKLTEAVMSLIELADETHPGLDAGGSERAVAIREFKELAAKIQIRKKAIQKTVEEDAERMLLRLKRSDRAAFDRVIDRARDDESRNRAAESHPL